MHCNESINVAINSQSYNNHSHVHMNMIWVRVLTWADSFVMLPPRRLTLPLMCVCVWGGHTHSTHTCTSYFISYAFSFPIRWLTSSAKQKMCSDFRCEFGVASCTFCALRAREWLEILLDWPNYWQIDWLTGQLTNWSSGRLTDCFDFGAFALIDDVIVGCIQALSRI